MDYSKIKGVVRILIIAWILFIGYFYELTDTRNLFEYITYFLIGSYISFDIKTDWKYLLMFILVWNIADETALVFANDNFKLIALIPVFSFVLKRFKLYKYNLESL